MILINESLLAVNDNDKEIIMKGINHWQAETCINFIPATKQHPHHIRFRTDREGCWSLIGRQASYYHRSQDVSIGKGCAHVGKHFHPHHFYHFYLIKEILSLFFAALF